MSSDPEFNTGESFEKVLLVSNDESVKNLLARVFHGSGYQLLLASDGEEALDVVEREKPFFVLTKSDMPKPGGVELQELIKERCPQTIVVVMEEPAVKTASGEAAPADFNVCLYLGNDPVSVKPAAHMIVHLLGPYFSDEDKSSIKIGLFEIIQNAIEHGNLEIDFQSKSEALETDNLHELFEERTKDPRYSARGVTVEMRMDKSHCQFVVTDDGPGFRWKDWFGSPNQSDLTVPHGRGILMTRFYFDKVAYNERGNQVTLTKKYS
jgi:CheY-like chemotaxis protein